MENLIQENNYTEIHAKVMKLRMVKQFSYFIYLYDRHLRES